MPARAIFYIFVVVYIDPNPLKYFSEPHVSICLWGGWPELDLKEKCGIGMIILVS